MKVNEEQVRAAIAEQAGEWFVANDAGPLDVPEAAALAEWLKSSPVHVEQFLGVSVIARDLRELGRDPEFSVDALLASARAEDDAPVQSLWPRVSAPARDPSPRRWVSAAVAMAAVVLVGVGLFSLWNAGLLAPGSAPGASAALHYETRHGEQMSLRLADESVVHLNTDSAVTIRYGKGERLITLTAGEADFEVAHDPQRAFRVSAGAAEVVAVGTLFDVRLQSDATVVTVVEGRVTVGLSRSNGKLTPLTLQLGANQQIRVAEGAWPAAPSSVDARHVTAWLRRQIVFDQQPLELVAAEFSRYSSKPIEIVTPALRNLQISGVFSTDDTGAFIAFLRSLKDVRVEVTPTRIRVSASRGVAAPDYT
jgi:transmembrane sensor